MSGTALAPSFRSKRHFDAEDSTAYHTPSKRVRHLSPSPPGRRAPRTERTPRGAGSPATLAALRGLFPGMDEKTVAAVLDACGDDVDAAIKCLGQLQLGAAEPGRQGPQPLQREEAQAEPDAGKRGAESGPHTAGPGTNGCAERGGVEGVGPRPQSAAEWVDALVRELVGARGMADAQQRAGRLLASFEQAVLAAAGGHAQGKGDSGTEVAALRAQVADLLRDNGILKRAVAIQNARMQEAVGAREGEVAALRATLAQFQEKVAGLELANYSLALHLRQATEGRSFAAAHRPPDVF